MILKKKGGDENMAGKTDETKIVEKNDQQELKEKRKDEIYWRIRPHHLIDFDCETGEFEARVELPGVPKENVKLRILPDLFDINATHKHTLYAITEYFPYVVNIDSVQGKYEHGLLSIKGKFKDKLADAVEINL